MWTQGKGHAGAQKTHLLSWFFPFVEPVGWFGALCGPLLSFHLPWAATSCKASTSDFLKSLAFLSTARSASAVDMSANRTTEHSTPQEHLLGVGREGGNTMQISSRADTEVRSAELREWGKPMSGRLGCWGAVQAPGTETLAENRLLGHPAGENNASFSSLSPGYLSVRVAQCCTSWWRQECGLETGFWGTPRSPGEAPGTV